MVDVLYGGPGGLGTGATKDTHFEQGAGTGAVAASASETDDRMGQAIAARTTRSGEPYLLIGVPGEAIGTLKKAGNAFYVHGTTSVSVNQDKTDVPGTAEAGDRFGAAVAGDASHIAIGGPNEKIGSKTDAGGLVLFDPNKLNTDNIPTPLSGIDQDMDTISGGAEEGDEFGAALSLTEYRPSGAAAATESILAIGSPGEGVVVGTENRLDAGRVVLVRVKADGTWSELRELKQGTADDDVSGTSETGDRMGETLTAVNTAPPRAVSTEATMKLAVGVPGEAIGTATKAGAVHTFSLLGSAGANDRWIEAGDGDGIPGPAGANQALGKGIHFTGSRLYVGMPYGPSAHGTLYALPLSNVTAGGTVAAVTTYQPGSNGLPNAGVDFGHAAR